MPPKGRRKQADGQQNAAANAAGHMEGGLDPIEREELLKELNEKNGDISQIEIPEKYCKSKNETQLVILSIEATDFKSYNGTQVIGPFHHVCFCFFLYNLKIFRLLLELLDQMVAEKAMLLILCCLYLVSNQIKFEHPNFHHLFTNHLRKKPHLAWSQLISFNT